MKKVPLLILSLMFTLININFVFAKEFRKEIHPGIEVTISTMATKADIKISNKNSSEFWGYVGIWKEKNNIGNYENPLYESSGSITIPAKKTVDVSFSGLDVSSNKKYYFTMTNRGGSKSELIFTSFWYGIELDEQDKNGGYEANVFGDPGDTREMFIALSKSEIPRWNELSSIELISVGKLVKSRSTSLIGYADGVLSLPKEKNGRYYLSLVAKDSSGNYDPIIQYNKNPVLFGLDKGEIFFNEIGFDKNSKTITGSVVAEKHKKNDIIPFTEITVSANILDSGTKELIKPLTSIKLEEKDGGKFAFIVKNIGLNEATFYDAEIIFTSNSGVSTTKNIKFSTDQGIIPETGKERDNFFDKNSYRLLAPIPGMTALLDPELCKLEQQKDPGQICDINAFLNFLLSLAIGAAAVVLVVRIIISGYGYMVSDIPFVKAKLKGNFIEALIGLLVALSAYLILNTVNPKLVSNDVKIGVVEFEVIKYVDIDIPEGGDLTEPISNNGSTPGFNCASGSKTNGFCMFGTIDKPKPTGQIPELIRFLESGYKLTLIRIYPNDRIFFTAEKGSDRKQFSTNGIGHGANGWAELGKGKEGDKKTPYGSYKIDRPPRKAPNQNTVMRSTRKDKNGVGYSMGGAVFNLNSRGIAIHSNNKNSQGNTAACILMYNDDLFALYPYIWVGLPVVIGP